MGLIRRRRFDSPARVEGSNGCSRSHGSARSNLLVRLAPYAVSALLSYLSLVILRHALVLELEMPMADAFESGLALGWYFDLYAVVFAALATQLLWAVAALPRRFGWALFSGFVWVASFANVLHYRFFDMRLDLWVIQLHWGDLLMVHGSAAQLAMSWPIVVSALLSLPAIAMVPLFSELQSASREPEPAVPEQSGRWLAARGKRLVGVVVLLVALTALHRGPRALNLRYTGSVLADNIVRVWVTQATSTHPYVGAGLQWAESLAVGEVTRDPASPSRQLARYRDVRDDGANLTFFDDTPTPDPRRPLLRTLAPSAEQTRALRARLGLPPEGPINVILLFVESVRALELRHPQLGPVIFPATRALLAGRAIDYRQAYSSSFTAGQTVRGQFSTLCSMLPNITGAATYIAHSTVRLRCLPDLLKEAGYVTAWMNTFRASFHGKRTFEKLHGTDLFFDGEAFAARGVSGRISTIGLADEPFLQEVVALVEELSDQGPVYANVLTISVHHPYRLVPGGKLPQDLLDATGGRTFYQGYLSLLRYEDKALAAFFETLFASQVADNTLVVLVADHSSGIQPHVPLTALQRVDMRFRIPMAFVTRDMPAPEVVEVPVHQVDVAPTIAAIVGVTGEVTWVGRNLLDGTPGRPFVYQDEHGLTFRTAVRGCYNLGGPDPLGCWSLAGVDPLLEVPTVPMAEQEAVVAFFRDTVLANMQAIALNLVVPP